MIASFFVEVNCFLYFRIMSRFPLLNSSSLTLALFAFLFPLQKEIYKENRFPPLLPSFSPSLAFGSLGISTIAHYVRLV